MRQSRVRVGRAWDRHSTHVPLSTLSLIDTGALSRRRSLVEVGFEAFAQVGSCSEEQALHGGDGGFENLGDFLVGHVLETPENDRHALGFREGGDRAADGFLQFAVRDFLGRGAGGGIGVADRRPVGVARIERDEAGALAAAHFVEDEIPGDREQPGGEFRGGAVARGALPDPDEDLLGDVLGVGGPTQHFGDGADDAELVALDEGFEGALVASFDREHERDVIGRRIVVWVCAFGHLRGEESGLNHGGARKAREIPLAAGSCIGFLGVPMSRPVVASYCTTFLKPEMLHIYRQVTGLKRHETFVVTRERMCGDRFPFPDLEILPEPAQPVLRRFYLKFLRRVPPLQYRGELGQLGALFARRHADLMHVYFGHTGVHLRQFLRAWDRPSVVSFHGADVMLREHRPRYALQMRELFGTVSLVLARSRSLADRLESAGCPPEKIRLNRTGIPLGDFAFAERRAPDNGEWKLVQACRLIKKKGLLTALEAFAQFRARFPRATLTIAGEGPMRGELAEAVEKLGLAGSVSFPGFLDGAELKALYAASHIFLHPSETTDKQDQEGIPNSMLEAMATGLPVAATLHGGIPEAVRDGVSGFLVPEKNPDALAEALVRLASSPETAAEMGHRASQAVREEFEQSRAVEKLEAIYDEATALGKPAALAARPSP